MTQFISTKNLFAKFVINYCKHYNGKNFVEDVTWNLRDRLQFNDSPSFKQMSGGEVDCVGSAVITKAVLETLFPNRDFFVVALPGLPWLSRDMWTSKHCAVLEKNKNKYRIIDPTPINGYGYGKITKLIPQSKFKKIGNTITLSKIPKLSNVKAWKKILYPAFLILADNDIRRILEIDNYRSLAKIAPTEPSGWVKEFWKLKILATNKTTSKDVIQKLFDKALVATPENFQLLTMYGQFLNEVGTKQKALEINSKAGLLKKKLLDSQKEMIGYWNQHFKKAKKDANWNDVMYYGGCIFWTKHKSYLVAGKKPEEIPTVRYRDNNIPLYRFSPAWFQRERVCVGIVKSNSHVPHGTTSLTIKSPIYGAKFRKEVVGINISLQGHKCIIGKKRDLVKIPCLYTSRTPIESHIFFVGLSKPELLITNYNWYAS